MTSKPYHRPVRAEQLTRYWIALSGSFAVWAFFFTSSPTPWLTLLSALGTSLPAWTPTTPTGGTRRGHDEQHLRRTARRVDHRCPRSHHPHSQAAAHRRHAAEASTPTGAAGR